MGALVILGAVALIFLLMDVLGFHLAAALTGRLPKARPLLYLPFIHMRRYLTRSSK